MCYTDGVGKLYFAFICQSCCDDVFCNVACRVCCGTVYLCAVFSGECSAAVTGISAVAVYDNLTSGQSCITVRSADDKAAGRVDEELGVLVYHFCRKDRIKHVLFNVCMDLLLCHIRIMLCGKYHRIQADRFSIFVVFYG